MSSQQRALTHDTGMSAHTWTRIGQSQLLVYRCIQELPHLFKLYVVWFTLFFVIRRKVSVTLDSAVLLSIQRARTHKNLNNEIRRTGGACNYMYIKY